MKKLLLVVTACLLSPFSITGLLAQSPVSMDQVYAHLENKYGLDRHAVGDLRITDQYMSEHNQATHIYMMQTIQGVDVYGTALTLTLSKHGRLSSLGHSLKSLNEVVVKPGAVNITPADAIKNAASSMGIQSRATSVYKRTMHNGMEVYDKTDVALQDIPVKLTYVPSSTGELQLAWMMEIEFNTNGNLYQTFVNATSGEWIAHYELTKHCRFEDSYLTHEIACADHVAPLVSAPPASPPPGSVSGQYRVLVTDAESPNHGSFELMTNLEDLAASPFGWHDIDGVDGADYTHTRGNNVHAFLDRNWDYASDRNVDGGVDLLFDFPFDEGLEPMGNQDVAVTNLFVRNNFMHDFSYAYGFNPQAGNFQTNNYGGEVNDGDHVNAHGQFGDDNTIQCGMDVNGGTECINNADFSSGTDGFNGRMRMFTWTRDNSSRYLDILEPVDLAGKILTGTAQFGVSITEVPVTGEVVIVDDGTPDASKGCLPLNQPELEGKIALIDRGLCDFSLKVYNAQEAGAIGAIICNFEDATINMGAGDMAGQVVIPSVFISSVECSRIRIAAGAGLVASLVAPPQGGPVKRDGSLDNGVIAHEFGHGISTRITGGPGNSSCLGSNFNGNGEEANGMGEGWSDYFALVTSTRPGDTGTQRRGIATYVSKEETNGRGIRTYPYSTDMTVNPHTYENIVTESLPHGVGSVWCAMLWDMYWAFVDLYGWDADAVHGIGGNNLAIQLVMDGIKLQPCQPSFTEARDAILLADTLNNDGIHSCMLWSVFARRGLGSNADAGSKHSRSDGTPGFDVPKSCLDEVRFTKNMTPEIKAGDMIDVTLYVVNYKDNDLNNVVIEDPIPNGCTYVDGSGSITPIVGNSLVFEIPKLGPDEEMTITYQLHSDPANNSIRLSYDDMENDPVDRWDVYFDPNGTVNNLWFPQDVIVKSGISAWGVGDVDTESEHFLQNYEPHVISGDLPVYRFYHYYDTENGADGGFMEISNNDGASWLSLEPYIFRNSYPRKLQYATFAIPNLYAFTGLSSPTLDMIPVYIDLSNWKGEEVKVRYRFGTDENTAGDGWYVDDVEIMDAIIYNSVACMTSDDSDEICTMAPERGTIVDSELTISTEEDLARLNGLALMPNPTGDLLQLAVNADKAAMADIGVYNLTGQLMQHSTWNLHVGINQKTLDVFRLTPGMYVIQVRTKEGIQSQKFIKE